jgi:hypothetical protein
MADRSFSAGRGLPFGGISLNAIGDAQPLLANCGVGRFERQPIQPELSLRLVPAVASEAMPAQKRTEWFAVDSHRPIFLDGRFDTRLNDWPTGAHHAEAEKCDGSKAASIRRRRFFRAGGPWVFMAILDPGSRSQVAGTLYRCAMTLGIGGSGENHEALPAGYWYNPRHTCGKGVSMRKLLLVGWLALPVLGAAYHYGPGQQQLVLDDVARILAQAEQAAAREDWSEAERQFDDALNRMPADRPAEARRIRLERAKAQMLVQKLPTAHQDLKTLVADLENDPTTDPRLLADARAALANSQYYMTWLLRLEGEPREEWEPEVEAARQTYRLLAEQCEQQADAAAAAKHSQDLEATVRLARMDLKELQGLPLPSQ